MIQELYLSNKESETMANKKDNNTREVEGEKSEKSENVVVHVDALMIKIVFV